MSLTLCKTLRDESATMMRAINSVYDQVDALVIGVDVASSDATREVAERLVGADVFTFSMSKTAPNFSAMRNCALERVQTEWALVLDGDEWMVNSERLSETLAATGPEYGAIQVRMMLEPRQSDGVPQLTYAFAKIHRKGRRFVGAIHEHIDCGPAEMIFAPELEVWHQRAIDPTTVTAEGNTDAAIELLRADAKGGSSRGLFYLGNCLRERGQFSEAIDCYSRYLSSNSSFEEEQWVARLYRARCLYWVGESKEAIVELLDCVGSRPWRAEPMMVLGEMWEFAKIPQMALPWYRMAAAQPLPMDRLFIEYPIYAGDAAEAVKRLTPDPNSGGLPGEMNPL